MPKYDDFDLDVKTTGTDGNNEKILSIVACTPGTCAITCKGPATLKSNCCIGSGLCSLVC